MGELVTGISIAKEAVYTAYKAYRKLPVDEPYLVGAVAMRDDSWRIVVGGRPGLAAIARSASEELDFGNFGTCSESERRALTIEMVRSLIKSAWKGYNRYVVKK